MTIYEIKNLACLQGQLAAIKNLLAYGQASLSDDDWTKLINLQRDIDILWKYIETDLPENTTFRPFESALAHFLIAVSESLEMKGVYVS